MPVAAIAAPIIAIGATAASAATVGITAAATIFAAVGAVGAVIGTVGYFTKSKELTIAGSILGGIGAIGGFASGMGLFGSGGGSLFGSGAEAAGSVATDVGSWATEVAPLAGDTVTATAAPAGGYTLESLANSGLEGGIAGFGEAGGVGMKNIDIIDLVNGVGADNFNALDTAAQLTDAQVAAPAAEVLPDTTIASAPQEAVLPEVAQEFTPDTMLADAQPPGLIDSAGGMPRDQFGNVIPQGDAAGGSTIGEVVNPGQPPDPAATSVHAATGQPDPGVTAVQPQATPEVPVSGTVDTAAPKVTGATETNASGFPVGGGPQGPSGGALMPTSNDASIWSRIFDMVEKRPTLALGALKAASSFISGAFSEGTTAEQRQAYAAQAEQNLAAANLARTQDLILQRRLRNMNDPIPVARPFTPPGLINSAGAVTGRPA